MISGGIYGAGALITGALIIRGRKGTPPPTEKYPKVIDSWRKNWPRLSNYFQYSKEIRRIIYTTNIIEGFYRQIRNVTKSKGAFTSEDALMKLLFLAQQNICSKWNRPVHNWNQTLAQLSTIFGDRLKLNI